MLVCTKDPNDNCSSRPEQRTLKVMSDYDTVHLWTYKVREQITNEYRDEFVFSQCHNVDRPSRTNISRKPYQNSSGDIDMRDWKIVKANLDDRPLETHVVLDHGGTTISWQNPRSGPPQVIPFWQFTGQQMANNLVTLCTHNSGIKLSIIRISRIKTKHKFLPTDPLWNVCCMRFVTIPVWFVYFFLKNI